MKNEFPFCTARNGVFAMKFTLVLWLLLSIYFVIELDMYRDLTLIKVVSWIYLLVLFAGIFTRYGSIDLYPSGLVAMRPLFPFRRLSLPLEEINTVHIDQDLVFTDFTIFCNNTGKFHEFHCFSFNITQLIEDLKEMGITVQIKYSPVVEFHKSIM